jgi:tRNA(Ile)-lysidine synthase
MPQTGKKLSPLEQKVLSTIRSHGMISPGDHVLAAVSGGADSTAMLHLLCGLRKALRIKLSVAHMDHQLRGEEARREAGFVRELAASRGIACVVEARDVAGYKAASGLSLQEAARDVRYAFFKDALAATGANKLALAHQADDQAETVLMRLLRGASLKGLAGIPACRDGYIIRPLIETGRSEIEAWLRERDLSFVPDSSAGEQQYLRNKIRHRLLPLLKDDYNPGIVETLGRTAALLRQDEKALEELVAGIIQSGSPGGEHAVTIAALQQAGPHLYGRLIRHILAGLKGDMRALSQRHIEAVIRLIEKPGPARTVQLPQQWCVRRQYGSLIFARRRAAQQTFYYQRDDIPEFLEIREIGRRLRFEVVELSDFEAVRKNADLNIAYIAADKTLEPLTVRSCHAGDIFHPLGAPGRKKLADLFVDSKIPVPGRRRVPVLLFGERIAWVCGLRMDEHFKLRQGQTKALKVTVEPAPQI